GNRRAAYSGSASVRGAGPLFPARCDFWHFSKASAKAMDENSTCTDLEGKRPMTKPGRKIGCVVGAAAIWRVAIVGRAPAQISDPEEGKSWFFLQKIAKDIEELDRCMSIVAADTDRSAVSIALKPYRAALSKKSELFVDEADAYVQHYAVRLGKDDTLRVFR